MVKIDKQFITDAILATLTFLVFMGMAMIWVWAIGGFR